MIQRFCHIHLVQLAICKAVTHCHGWGFAHLQMAPKHWLCINEDDLVWATAAPGWQKWVWSPFYLY